MVFASLIFLFLFLPLNLILYYSFEGINYRNWVLIVFSIFFYSWGEPVWVLLLILTAIIDYTNGLLIEKFRGRIWSKVALVCSIIINLSLLMTFKYSDFIIENVNNILGSSFTKPSFALPIGISFYTFQTISYTIDVYKGEVEAQRSFPRFLMFVSLYHQLVAGPIVRYSHIATEIDKRKFDIADISEGINRICRGLFKKVFIANIAGELAKQYLESDITTLTVGAGWFGLLMFTVQIYFDFSGYSDMAIGLGRLFGFHYHENFNYPYTATSITDFWRRWHISLSTFFRDYIYIPMGGNRKHQMFNLFVVWFLTGLWHGASWNFIIWGLYFGLLIVLEKLILLKVFDMLPKFISHIYSLFFIIIGWAIFYFTDINKLKQFGSLLFGQSENPLWDFEIKEHLMSNIYWLTFCLIVCLPIFPIIKNFMEHRMKSPKLFNHLLIVANIVFLIVSVTFLVGKSYNPFLYFRF